jgi:hypothetical protein
MQRHVALLKDGADSHSELLAAGVAFVEAEAGGFAFHFRDALLLEAVRALSAMRPDFRLNPLVSGRVVL